MDSDTIKDVVRRRYAEVAKQPGGKFAYPVGRKSVERLGYLPDFVERIPLEVVDHFVGVGNPFSIGEPEVGWHVVDVGCGAGFDSQVAAQYVGPTGRVVGVDMSPEMVMLAETGLADSALTNLEFAEGQAEALPVASGWADLVISNGVLNLAPCKPSVFSEIARVLRPGGRFQAADLILVKELPCDLRWDGFAWSN